MTLNNLQRIQLLIEFQPTADDISKLLISAKNSLTDAACREISNETRFAAAYRCILDCAMLGLWSNGFRTSTSKPGHHNTAIQCLTLTIGYDPADVLVLESIRRQRVLTEYEGDIVSADELKRCIDASEQLFHHTNNWIMLNPPELSS